MTIGQDSTTLARLDRARQLLASATDFWDIREIHDVAEASRAYAKVSGMGQEAINYAITIKLEAARKGGEALSRMRKQTGGDVMKARSSMTTELPPTLSDLGISKDQSSDWQALARVDDSTFSAVIEQAKSDGTISETAIVRAARSMRAKAAYAERQAEPKPVPACAPGTFLGIADAHALPLANDCVDLIVTSPPYALDIAYHSGDIAAEAWFEFMADWLAEALRVTKPRGRLALNIPLDTSRPFERPTYAQALAAAARVGWLYKATIVWDEGNTTKGNRSLGSVNSAARPHHVSPAECIPLLYKNEWGPSSDGPDDISPDEWQDWGRTVWRFSGEGRAWEQHPAAFPFELPRRLIRYLSRVGDVVCDPFLGSGTTAAAALLGRRQFIGFDISPEYVASARRRVQAAKKAQQ